MGHPHLGSGAVRYNPLSYHNGSIWPHDNSLIGYGCFRYRQFETGMTGRPGAARFRPFDR